MERGGEKGGGEKVSGFRGKVRIKKVLTDKVAPTRNEEKLQDEERVRSEGKTSG